jgi:AcrR family transcriptional regulator
MAQILKEDVRQRIYEAAIEEFYEKDFKTATIRDIAVKAEVPAGLVYSYYPSKQALFETIVAPSLQKIEAIIQLEEEESCAVHPFEVFQRCQAEGILDLFTDYKKLIILIDKSRGTKYQNTKDKIIQRIEAHIKEVFDKKGIYEYDDLLIHICASSITEGMWEIVRHYQGAKWAERMLELLAKQYFCGINGLIG